MEQVHPLLFLLLPCLILRKENGIILAALVLLQERYPGVVLVPGLFGSRVSCARGVLLVVRGSQSLLPPGGRFFKEIGEVGCLAQGAFRILDSFEAILHQAPVLNAPPKGVLAVLAKPRIGKSRRMRSDKIELAVLR